MKLNTIVKNNHVVGYGFKAIVDLSDLPASVDCKVDIAIVSSLSPAVMSEKGIYCYYAPVFPRGTVYNTAEELLSADLDVNVINVDKVDGDFEADLIVSRHPGTIAILSDMYPDADIVTGNISPEELDSKRVAGTLPPHLIQYCAGYRAAVINDFDYSCDGDLTGEELKNRFEICDPITVVVKGL